MTITFYRHSQEKIPKVKMKLSQTQHMKIETKYQYD